MPIVACSVTGSLIARRSCTRAVQPEPLAICSKPFNPNHIHPSSAVTAELHMSTEFVPVSDRKVWQAVWFGFTTAAILTTWTWRLGYVSRAMPISSSDSYSEAAQTVGQIVLVVEETFVPWGDSADRGYLSTADQRHYASELTRPMLSRCEQRVEFCFI